MTPRHGFDYENVEHTDNNRPLSDYELIAVKRWRQWPGEEVDTAVLLDRALATIESLRVFHDRVVNIASNERADHHRIGWAIVSLVDEEQNR